MFNLRKQKGPRGQRELLGVSVSASQVSLASVKWLPGSNDIELWAESTGLNGRDAVSGLAEVHGRYVADGGTCRSCVVGLGNDGMRVELFELKGENDLRGTLELEVERVERFGSKSVPVRVAIAAGIKRDERPNSYFVGFVNEEAVEAARSLVASVGMELYAVDYEGCGWRRVAPDADALIVQEPDGNGADNVIVCGFSPLEVRVRTKSAVNFAMLASHVSTVLGQFEHDRVLRASSKNVCIAGDETFCRVLQESRQLSKQYTLTALEAAGETAPAWALAYGLALYGVSEELDGEVAYAF